MSHYLNETYPYTPPTEEDISQMEDAFRPFLRRKSRRKRTSRSSSGATARRRTHLKRLASRGYIRKSPRVRAIVPITRKHSRRRQVVRTSGRSLVKPPVRHQPKTKKSIPVTTNKKSYPIIKKGAVSTQSVKKSKKEQSKKINLQQKITHNEKTEKDNKIGKFNTSGTMIRIGILAVGLCGAIVILRRLGR